MARSNQKLLLLRHENWESTSLLLESKQLGKPEWVPTWKKKSFWQLQVVTRAGLSLWTTTRNCSQLRVGQHRQCVRQHLYLLRLHRRHCPRVLHALHQSQHLCQSQSRRLNHRQYLRQSQRLCQHHSPPFHQRLRPHLYPQQGPHLIQLHHRRSTPDAGKTMFAGNRTPKTTIVVRFVTTAYRQTASGWGFISTSRCIETAETGISRVSV